MACARIVTTFILGALGGSALVCLLGNPTGSTPASPPAAREEPLPPAALRPVPPAPPAPPEPTRSAVDGALELTGKTRPAPGRQALIAPTVLHPIIDVKVKPGERVKKDQILVKLDDDEPQADVRGKKAALEAIRLVGKEARRHLGPAEWLFAKGSLPEKNLHVARMEAARSEHDEKAALSALEASQAELEHYTVTAPIDGVVTWLNAAPGMVSRPGTTIWGEILDLRVIDVQCELEADRIVVGQKAQVWRERFPDVRWMGEVVFVGVAADERTGLVPVRLRIQDAAERLRCHVEVKVRFGTRVGVPAVADQKGGP